MVTPRSVKKAKQVKEGFDEGKKKEKGEKTFPLPFAFAPLSYF
jgi:hypothetical protein